MAGPGALEKESAHDAKREILYLLDGTFIISALSKYNYALSV